jgi:uncharacterized protein
VKEILLGNKKLSARNAPHPAIMENQGIRELLRFDAGFDGYPGIQRLGATS